MKHLRLLLLILALPMLFFTACGDTSSTQELTNTAEYEDTVLTLGESSVNAEDNTITVKATFTNNSEEPIYALSAFSVKAFQNDKELENVSDINDGEAALIQEVKNGESQEVSYVFALDTDLSSPVEVYVCSPTADEEQLAKIEITE